MLEILVTNSGEESVVDESERGEEGCGSDEKLKDR